MNISFKPVSVFLKKYTALIPSISILVVSLLLYLPVMMIGGSVKKNMANSVSMAQQIQSELNDVPSKDKPAQIKSYMDKLEEDASKIETLAMQSSQRDLITYDYVIFPKPTDSSAQIFQEFGRKYRLAIEEVLTNLKAKDAPSQAEIISKTGGARAAAAAGAGFGGMPVINSQQPMVDALCLSRAREISVYAHPTAFPWYSFWEKYQYEGEEQALQDCWNAQVAFWIYQDVTDTILKMNGANSNVYDASPVKRFLGVSFSGPVISQDDNTSMFMRGFSNQNMRTTDGRDVPNYVTAELFSNFMDFSPSARSGNEETDIVHFAVSVVVDSSQVLEFMKELCSEKTHKYRENFSAAGKVVENARHNQISILQSSIKAVEPYSASHNLYRYGKAATMQLDLVCEYQFYKKSYDNLKPASIRTYLGMPEETPAETPAGTTEQTTDGGTSA